MAFLFWKKKPAATNDADNYAAAQAQAQAAVDAAVASAQRSDKEWQRQAARLRQEEKRREKQRAKAAKRELAEMKKQAKQARKARTKADKVAKKQARMVLKVQKRERKAERMRAKAIVKLRRASEKRHKRLVRKRQREERRRRKQARAQAVTPMADAPLPQGAVADTSVPLAPPPFKEDTRCKSCHSTFQRLPTRRRHHCRNCGESFCSKCLSRTKRPIPWFKLDKPQKVCFSCDVQVFNGMGGMTRGENRAASPAVASATPAVSPTPERSSPLRSQRSASFQSEQPEDSPRTVSPPGSRTGLSLRLHPRSRRDTSSTKSKKSGSLWSLPIRPLLKRKSSADQLRNRNWDLDLRLEKEEMLARQRQSQMIVVTGAPQFATAS